jgi:hypothetical protein
VGIELCLNLGVCIRKAGLESSVASFAYADGGKGSLYESEFALLHDSHSSSSDRECVTPVEIKRHHYPVRLD